MLARRIPKGLARLVARPQQVRPPCRRLSDALPPVYGAPYTNSVSFEPLPSRRGSFLLAVRVPDYPTAEVELHATEGVDAVLQRVQAATGAASVALVRNGALLPPASPTVVTDLFGACVELALDGVRYNVNGGLRLAETGAVPKPTKARAYTYLALGGTLTIAGLFAFWSAVIPEHHKRWNQHTPRH
jgi:hypothetical protein